MGKMVKGKQYWLLKTEPGEWSWEDQAANGGVTKWDGVKNKQAQKHLKSMKEGDLCFFYHSGASARCVVGVVSVVKEWYSESGDKNSEVVVDVKAVGEMRRRVDLKDMKQDGELKGFVMFRQPRLSVMPVPEEVWKRICELGNGFEGDGIGNDGGDEEEDLGTLRPRFTELLKRPWLTKPFNLRAFSSTPPAAYTNQSRGGLRRFFSETLPSSKAISLSTIELFNGKGGLVEGCIQNIDRTAIDFVALEEPKLVLPQSQWHVFAAFGSLKGGRADWLVEKCTELGATSVTPLLTERSSVITDNRVERLQRVILAATKQCQRLHEMKLNHPMKIDNLVPLVAKSKLSFIAIAAATPLVGALTSTRTESSGLIIVGPEGDFTEKEVNMIIEAGSTAVGLGPHRLRVETATIAILATLMLWSDSQQITNP
ncbi:EVE domain - like 1 [Theobroma cacao]|nr:EVE domain - like 1 [Theobroma cacao]